MKLNVMGHHGFLSLDQITFPRTPKQPSQGNLLFESTRPELGQKLHEALQNFELTECLEG